MRRPEAYLIIEFIGRNLYHQKETFDPEILEKSKALWTKRFNTVKSSGSSLDATELIPFGWWFASGKFDDSWAMDQLIKVLDFCGWAELDHLVIERLATLASNMSRQVIQFLRMMIEGDKEGWEIVGWCADIYSILNSVIQGSDPEAREAATDLVHRLGARGHFDFKDLLPPQ